MAVEVDSIILAAVFGGSAGCMFFKESSISNFFPFCDYSGSSRCAEEFAQLGQILLSPLSLSHHLTYNTVLPHLPTTLEWTASSLH
jgi:hypothetical protein